MSTVHDLAYWLTPAHSGKLATNVPDLDDFDLAHNLRHIRADLTRIARRLDTMAVDQATFDTALAAFLADIQAGLDAIAAKLANEAPAVDLSAELGRIQTAQANFDAAIQADTAPPAPAPAPAPADVPAPADAPAADPAAPAADQPTAPAADQAQ